jgi:ATP-dependent Lhr-like helicase
LRGDWSITTDNFLIRARGEDVDGRTFADALASLSRTDFWEDESVWKEVAESLPSYRLSKFQPLMPPWMEREVLARYLLDVAGARAWLLRTSAWRTDGIGSESEDQSLEDPKLTTEYTEDW